VPRRRATTEDSRVDPALGASPNDLTQRLKEATRLLHARAERTGVMAQLLARTVSVDDYVDLLRALRALYGALEAALDRLRSRLAALGASPLALERCAALEADLAAFAARRQGRDLALPPAAQELVERLQRIDADGAHRLLAHAYVRHLGDLHGGQILAPLVRARFGFDSEEGTRFYRFGDAARVLALRTGLRAQLSSARLSSIESSEVVAEAVWTFEAHCRLFEQISAAGLRGAAQ
jgi:heme oxygenase (biliverdin-producing, ferredoxin)